MDLEHTAWPEFNGAKAVSFPRRNNNQYILFGANAETVSAEDIVNNRCEELTRIIYRKMGEKALLLGTYVNPDERGSHLGLELIDYFVENAREVAGRFGGTGLIGKPIFAKQLVSRGFVEDSNNFEVAIVPKTGDDGDSHIPNVIVLKDRVKNADRWKVKNSSGTHRFYNEVSRDRVPEERIRSLARVALHTPYNLIAA